MRTNGARKQAKHFRRKVVSPLGMELPINMVVVIGVLVLVLASVVFFFASSSFQFSSETEARGYFASSCRQLSCDYETSALLRSSHGKFFEACKYLLGPQVIEKPYTCLQECGCSMETTNETLQENVNDFAGILRRE